MAAQNGFVPIIYLKAGCPHCFKLRLFLLEAGIAGDFEEREFTPGDASEAPIRAKLGAYLERVTFPTVQVALGRYLADSDAIVAHYAAERGIDPVRLPLFTAYAGTLLPRFRAARQELKALQERLAAPGG